MFLKIATHNQFSQPFFLFSTEEISTFRVHGYTTHIQLWINFHVLTRSYQFYIVWKTNLYWFNNGNAIHFSVVIIRSVSVVLPRERLQFFRERERDGVWCFIERKQSLGEERWYWWGFRGNNGTFMMLQAERKCA